MAWMRPKTGTAVLPLRGKVYGSEEMKSLLCFPGRIATYPSQCQSQIVCPVDLFVGCEPVRGADSDRSNICSRSQRPVGKGDGNQTSRLDFSHWTRHLRGQNLWSGFLTIYRLPISLCLEAGGALGAWRCLPKVSVTNAGLQRARGRLIWGQPWWGLIIIAAMYVRMNTKRRKRMGWIGRLGLTYIHYYGGSPEHALTHV